MLKSLKSNNCFSILSVILLTIHCSRLGPLSYMEIHWLGIPKNFVFWWTIGASPLFKKWLHHFEAVKYLFHLCEADTVLLMTVSPGRKCSSFFWMMVWFFAVVAVRSIRCSSLTPLLLALFDPQIWIILCMPQKTILCMPLIFFCLSMLEGM